MISGNRKLDYSGSLRLDGAVRRGVRDDRAAGAGSGRGAAHGGVRVPAPPHLKQSVQPRIARNDRLRSGVGRVMTTVGIIGSGMIGGTVARLSVAAGYHVVVSNSRGPETLAELAAELAPLATAGPAEQAAEAGDPGLVSAPAK